MRWRWSVLSKSGLSLLAGSAASAPNADTCRRMPPEQAPEQAPAGGSDARLRARLLRGRRWGGVVVPECDFDVCDGCGGGEKGRGGDEEAREDELASA